MKKMTHSYIDIVTYMHKGALSGVTDKAPIPEAFYLCIIRHKQRVIDILSILKSENKYFNIEVQFSRW